ncbi:peptidase M23 [Candidatus Nitrosoglobus terrae]|uniref:Peptidase M23 n=1 Tax=Candidatus Nitrosoglobus terrae TaxID=1630141 RepID=A0A1Q2SNR8_9GAMM|nr:peptidoglycan DD-metalloendopeptidase family protein [Candidatus Nitrosoglobus terrae]BAW80772.1 peptidase M23 [Candidatus Nitrosoglobus terrae]
MTDQNYCYHIQETESKKIYPCKKRRFKKNYIPWIIILGCISALSTPIGLALYERELQSDPPILKPTSFYQTPISSTTKNLVESIKPQKTIEAPLIWQDIIIKKGDTLSYIFSQIGLSSDQVNAVMSLGKLVRPLAHLQLNQLLQIAIKENINNQRQLAALRLNFSPINYLEIRAKNDSFLAKQITRETETRNKIITGVIKNSLFKDGTQAELTSAQVMRLTHIFSWSIDLALDLRPGDTFKVLFEEYYLQGTKVKNGSILAAEFTSRNKIYRAIRYTKPNGITDYYTPEGLNIRKAFLRAPVSYSRISSHFNLGRKHPILNQVRPHRGVDYAAPAGTPIKAAGAGKVTFIGRKGGYGNVIVLQHGIIYSTLYAHLSRFKHRLKVNAKIKQGEIIGYVGQTGLATGPHLHYEFMINHIHHDPLTVKLPQANPIPRLLKQDFQKTAARLVAKLDTTSTTTVVFNQ